MAAENGWEESELRLHDCCTELILNVLLINCLIDTSSQVFLVELSEKNDNELTAERLKERLS